MVYVYVCIELTSCCILYNDTGYVPSELPQWVFTKLNISESLWFYCLSASLSACQMCLVKHSRKMASETALYLFGSEILIEFCSKNTALNEYLNNCLPDWFIYIMAIAYWYCKKIALLNTSVVKNLEFSVVVGNIH